MLLSARSLPPASQHNSTLHRSLPSREVTKSVNITRARGREYILYVSVFLASIGCNLVLISLVDSVSGQRPSCVLRCPLHFLTFPLPGGIEPTLGSAVPTPHHKPPQNCGNFLQDGGLRFHPRGRQIITRLHDVTVQNTVNFQNNGSAAWTINLAVLHKTIRNIYEAYDTVPSYTVCTGEKYVTCHLTQHNAACKLASYLRQNL